MYELYSLVYINQDIFCIQENKPFEAVEIDHNKKRLSYQHQYIDLYQVVDAHAINQGHVKSENSMTLILIMTE